MEIPKRHWIRYDGFWKSFTKDCVGCEWYRTINNTHLCGRGVAFKYLSPTEKPRKCEVKDRREALRSSVKYLDGIIK